MLALTSLGEDLLDEVVESRNKAIVRMGDALEAVAAYVREGDFASAQNVAFHLTGQVYPINVAHQLVRTLTDFGFAIRHTGF